MCSKDQTQTFTLKYRFRPFITIISLLLAVLFLSSGPYLMRSMPVSVRLLFLCLTVLFIVIAGVQLRLPRKQYHILIKRLENVMLIDGGKSLRLSDIKSVSLSWKTTKGATIDLLQLGVSPEAWCTYYKKETRKQQYCTAYETLYIVLPITNQTHDEINALVDFLVQSGIAKQPFVNPVLGKYPGVPRSNQYSDAKNAVVIKQKRNQKISTALKVVSVIFGVIYLAYRFLKLLD